MRQSVLAATLAGLVMVAPAKAGLFDWMGGSDPVRKCTPDDRACLILAASDTRIADFTEREHDMQIQSIAAGLAKAWYLADAQTRAAIGRMVEDADEDGKLRAALDEEIAVARPLPELTLTQADTALADAALPDPESGDLSANWTVDGFVQQALEQAIARDESKEATVFWLSHVDQMWQQAPGAFRMMQRWTAQNDLAALDAYSGEFALSGARGDEVWDDLAMIAAAKCQTGSKIEGERLLAILEEQFGIRSPQDPVIHLYARAKMFPAWLECRSEDEARAELAAIEEEKPGAQDFIREKYTDEKEQAFVLSAAHDTVQFPTTRAFATWLQEHGRPEEAREMYERGVISASTMEIGENGVRFGSEPISWETVLDDMRYDYAYGADPARALRYFLDAEGDPARSGYDEMQRQMPYLDQIAALWPAPLSREAGQVALERMRHAVKDDEGQQNRIDALILFLAGLPEQPSSCSLSEPKQAEILAHVPHYRYRDDRFLITLSLVRYRDGLAARAGEQDAAACALAPSDL